MKIKTCLICNNDFEAQSNKAVYCPYCKNEIQLFYQRRWYQKTKGKGRQYKKNERYSGQTYTNSKERLAEIKAKYQNGVTYNMILEML